MRIGSAHKNAGGFAPEKMHKKAKYGFKNDVKGMGFTYEYRFFVKIAYFF